MLTRLGPVRVASLHRLASLLLLATACAATHAAPTASPIMSPPSPGTPAGTPSDSPPVAPAGPSFADDIAFLRAHGGVEVLEDPGPSHGRVAVSPQYQARVMTSAVAPGAPSLGWIHRAFIASGTRGTAFDNYGGEDRFWLGPEGGQFGLYFPPGAPFTFDRWQTPHELQEGAWEVTARARSRITMRRAMHVTSYAGTAFDLEVTRTVAMLAADEVERRLGAPLPPGVDLVAFETTNRVTNTGARAWTRDAGLPSIWILAMYNPAPDAHVIIPFGPGRGEVVNDRYFGKVPGARLAVDAARGYLVFTCDGKLRSKIGVGPARARSVLGSYSAAARLLTLVSFDPPPAAATSSDGYVNSMWEHQEAPFAGDVVNSYNDGPVAPGQPPLGGFYEIETSSPALALAPGASAVHTQRTLHLTGERASLEPLAARALGLPELRLP